MTRSEILAMQPGRELDRMIDERFFGVLQGEGPDTPPYSADMTAAWVVVGKLLAILSERDEHGQGLYEFSLDYHGGNRDKVIPPSWECIVGHPVYDSVGAYGATAPEAIAKAALLAVGEGR